MSKIMYQENIHNFRTFAICAIVCAHALHNFNWDHSLTTFNLLDGLFNQASVWFFFISGYLFQHLSPRFSAKEFFSKKFKYVILPYLILSVPALIASISFVDQNMPTGFDEKGTVTKVLLFLVTGKHLEPFWFVPTISLIFLLSPILIKMDRAGWPYWILILVLPLSAFLGRDGFLHYAQLNSYYNAVGMAVYLLPVYMFGMLLSKQRDLFFKHIRQLQYPLLIIATAAYVSHYFEHKASFDLVFIFKISTAPLFVYYLALYGKTALKKLHRVGEFSFGVFFIHGYFLSGTKMILMKMGLDSTWHGALATYLLYAFVVMLVSIMSLSIGKQLLGSRSRMVIGV